MSPRERKRCPSVTRPASRSSARTATHVRAVKHDELVRGPDELDVVECCRAPHSSSPWGSAGSASTSSSAACDGRCAERPALGDAGVEQRLRLAVRFAQIRWPTTGRRGLSCFALRRRAQRRRRIALRVEREVDGQQSFLERLVRRDRTDLGDRHGEPSWRCETRARAPSARNPSLRRPVSEAIRKCVAKFLQRLRRQLLGEQLDQQGCHGHTASLCCSGGSIGKPSASRASTYAVATSRERLRMRPI